MKTVMGLSRYEALSHEERRAWINNLHKRLSPDFDLLEPDLERDLLPTYLHRKTGMPFKLVVGGEFEMGLSKEEEYWAQRICDPIPANLEEMRPIVVRQVETFLMSVTPVLEGQMNQAAEPGRRFFPNGVTHDAAKEFAETFGFRLPSEIEWEYACRGGRQTLFPWGNDLLSDVELESWLTWDLSDLGRVAQNRFGFGCLFTGEWCADSFLKSYAPGAELEPGSYVVRGGGAYFWPWQDEEWVWCMSAMRMPSKDLLDGTCSFRLVFDLGEG